MGVGVGVEPEVGWMILPWQSKDCLFSPRNSMVYIGLAFLGSSQDFSFLFFFCFLLWEGFIWDTNSSTTLI